MKALAIIGFILTALYTCLICVLRKRILLAIGIVKEAARALAAMPIIVLMPVFQCIAIVLFLVPWVIYSLYLASSGDIQVHEVESGGVTTQYRTMNYSTNQRYAFLYLLFCWYWTSEFILACGQIISALSISAWYFTRDKKTEGNATVLWVPPSPFHSSLSLSVALCRLSPLRSLPSLVLCLSRSLLVSSSDLHEPSRHRSLWLSCPSDHQNYPCRAGLSAEEGQEVRQPAGCVPVGLFAVLHVVSGEVHALPEQECLHTDCHLRILLLQSCQSCLLSHRQKCLTSLRCQHGWGLCPLPWTSKLLALSPLPPPPLP
jgi:hypothetical protein